MKKLLRKLRRVVAVVSLLLAAVLVAPFLLTTPLARLVLWQIFPANKPSVGSAKLSLSGTLVLHDVVLHDTGALAQRPLVSIGEFHSSFAWAELLSRRIRQIDADDVTVYLRSNSLSPLSLLDLFLQQFESDLAAESTGRPPPLWLNALQVQGMIHSETIRDLVSADTDWPLTLQMTMAGDRMDPTRQLHVAIGEVRQLPEKIGEKPARTATKPASQADAAFGLRAEIETQRVAGRTRVVVHSLAAKQVSLTMEAEPLRQYVAKLPGELQGRIEANLKNLSASGQLDLRGPANNHQFVGSLAFAGLRLRIPGGEQMRLSFDDLTGAAKIATPFPLGSGTAITIERLQASNAQASIEADALRRYAPKLPVDLHGPIAADLETLDISGWVGAGTEEALGFRGNVRLQDLSVHSPVGGKYAFALDRLTVAGSVESRLDRWAPAALKVRDGAMQWVALTYSNNAVSNFTASWRIESQMLMADHCTAEIFAGNISGSLAWDLATYAMPPRSWQVKSINMHYILANVSPEHIDAEGNASGFLQLMRDAEGELSGYMDMAFDGPGILKIGEIEAVKRMLVGNFGLDLANLAMHDLKQYPFQEGKLSLESSGKNSQLKIKFVRQPRTAADVKPPHKEMINGTEVWVGSLVVPTIDMTIPITGKSLADILSIVSGMHPLIETVSE